MIPLHAPDISPLEQAAMADCMSSGWISSAAPQIEAFEQLLQSITGADEVVALQSGTAALHLALVAAGLEPGDEVLVPDLTFIATANAVRYVRGVPVLVDAEAHSWQMDLELARAYLEAHPGKVKAVVLVHVLGYAADAEAWLALAREHGIILIEDAAGAIGTNVAGKHVGIVGDMGILSFNGNKLVTTGGGGAVLCRDSSRAHLMRHLANQAKMSGIAYDHDQVGYNYRMTGLGAALGVAQLQRLPELLDKHRHIFGHYRSFLKDAVFPAVLPESAPNHWLTTARVPDRDRIHAACTAAGIQVRPFWTPLHLQAPYRACTFLGRDCVSESIWQQAISFPSGSGLTADDLKTVKDVIERGR